MRVVHRVHGETAHGGPNTPPAHRARFAVAAQIVLVVTHFANRGAAVDMHLASLTGLEAQVGIDAFARGVLHGAARAARDLAALAGLDFDVVYGRSHRDVAQRHGVAGLDRCVRTGTHFVTGRKSLGRQNVTALAVGITHQRNVRRAVWIVFETLDHAHDAVLVPLEIDDAVLLARAAADMARGDAAEVIARTRLVLRNGERRVRVALVQMRAVYADDRSCARRCGLELDETHDFALEIGRASCRERV